MSQKKRGSFAWRVRLKQDRSEAIFPTDKFEMAFARFTHRGGLCKALNLFHFGVVRSILHPDRDGGQVFLPYGRIRLTKEIKPG